MIFSEKKLKKGFLYRVKDIFGSMEFRSPEKLGAELLDDIFMAVFELKENSKIIKGKIEGTGISYKYYKKNQWTKIKEKKVVDENNNDEMVDMIKNALKNVNK